MNPQKRCTKCGQTKELSAFDKSPSSRSKDGFYKKCRECREEQRNYCALPKRNGSNAFCAACPEEFAEGCELRCWPALKPSYCEFAQECPCFNPATAKRTIAYQAYCKSKKRRKHDPLGAQEG